jgi:hypothetical protein
MLVTGHASRLILGRPMRFDRATAYDYYWPCGCRAKVLDACELDVAWCTEHREIFENTDLKLQA